MTGDRSWMYAYWRKDGCCTKRFRDGVKEFLEVACAHPERMDGRKIKCPCTLRKCRNRAFRDVEEVEIHLIRNGFIPEYHIWTKHGEIEAPTTQSYSPCPNVDEPPDHNFETMVMDAAGSSFTHNYPEEENQNPDSLKFYNSLQAANKPLYTGCNNYSHLSFGAEMMNLKAEHNLSERGFDGFATLFKRASPKDNHVPNSSYEAKRLVHGLNLPVEMIHCCQNGCMLYWREDESLRNCKFCCKSRYKSGSDDDTESNQQHKSESPVKQMHYFSLMPRLLRLYASNATATEMSWHAEHEVLDGVMQHPSDSFAWIHFNDTYRDFSAETRNIRLGLCTDGFQPFGQFGQQYSC